jgi:Flp pilus assembly protein TadG
LRPKTQPLRCALQLRGVAADCSGMAAVEMAIVLPVLLAFLFGFIEVGQALWTQAALQSAVEAAARCAAIDTGTCGTPAAVQTYASAHAPGLTVAASSFTVAKPSCGSQVSIAYRLSSVAWPIASITLNARACHP